MSSVFGLNARPQIASCGPRGRRRARDDLVDEPLLLRGIRSSTAASTRSGALFLGRPLQCLHILRKHEPP
jgi:hypothetical protein